MVVVVMVVLLEIVVVFNDAVVAVVGDVSYWYCLFPEVL